MAVRALERGGMPGLLVCSGSEEQQALAEQADLVVDGPDGVLELLADRWPPTWTGCTGRAVAPPP